MLPLIAVSVLATKMISVCESYDGTVIRKRTQTNTYLVDLELVNSDTHRGAFP